MHSTLPALLTCSLALALAAPVSAQLLAARENPFAVGRHHLNVTDVEAHKRF